MSEERNENPEITEEKNTRDLSEISDEFSHNVENYEAPESEDNPFEPISKRTSRIQPLPEERLTAEEVNKIEEEEEEEDEYEYYDDDGNDKFMDTLKKFGIALGALLALSLLAVLLFLGLKGGGRSNNSNNNPSLNPTIHTPGPVATETTDTATADPNNNNGGTLVVDDVTETARPEGSIADNPDTVITLKDLVGLTVADAKKYGKDNDLNIEVEEKSSDQKEGVLIAQSPAANTEVKPGDTVTVTVSIGNLDPSGDATAANDNSENKTDENKTDEKKNNGGTSNGNSGNSGNTNSGTAAAGTYNLKDMTGTSFSTATNTLTANKIGYTASECYSDKSAGTIISQSPKTGTIKEGSKVEFVVSRGPIAVLNFKSLQKADFEHYLNTLRDGCINASATYVEEETSEVLEGTIADVRAGDKTAIGTNAYDGEKFTVVIAKRPTVQLGDYAGSKYSDVKSWMFNNGVKTKTIYQYSDSVKEGVVISTDPSKTKIQKGKTIKIYVSKGSYTAYDFTGKPFSYLQEDINKANSEGAKIKVVTTYKPSTTVPKDSIISQQQTGSTVNVVLSNGKLG